MARRIDLTMERRGNLVALEVVGKKRSQRRGKGGLIWACRCDCGKVVRKETWVFRSKVTWQCCHVVDGVSRTPEYRTWERMKTRCYNPKSHRFRDYGGRGIGVCERWRSSFANFLTDIGKRPGAFYSIERIDNDGDYEPGNCRWASRSEQGSNRRNTVVVDLGRRRVKLVDLLKGIRIAPTVVRSRLALGWPLDKAISAPVRAKKRKLVPRVLA